MSPDAELRELKEVQVLRLKRSLVWLPTFDKLKACDPSETKFQALYAQRKIADGEKLLREALEFLKTDWSQVRP